MWDNAERSDDGEILVPSFAFIAHTDRLGTVETHDFRAVTRSLRRRQYANEPVVHQQRTSERVNEREEDREVIPPGRRSDSVASCENDGS